MMKQLQKMQKQMEEQAKAFESKEFEATAGGGAVRVTVVGGREVSKITLDKDAVDPDDVEMLELATYSYAMENADPHARQAARYTAPSHQNQGVYEVIEAYLDGRLCFD